MAIRSPICSVLGHVDHGKSSILDFIRETAIVAGEAGGITQAIGASIIPIEMIKKKCGKLLDQLNMKFTIPGLLFIDTPGHAAFTSLRKRGGSLADIAILVVDINEGFKPQTVEAIDILKTSKTPFIIAANKIDLIHGWKSHPEKQVIQNINSQEPSIIEKIEVKLYELVGKVNETTHMNSERFDRVEDFTKQIAIVPTSAKTGEGLPELLMVITGLAQRYLEKTLHIEVKGNAKGSILEVKETKGLGTTADVILYDGTLKVNDTVVIGGIGQAIVTKVKALMQPTTLCDMRDKKGKYCSVKEATAATGVRISAPELNKVISGMPLLSGKDSEIEKMKEEVQQQVEEVMIETEMEGIVIKADTLGSLEALINLLKAANVPIRKAMIGDVTRKDVIDAESNMEKDPFQAVVLGFNVKVNDEAKSASENVKIITSDIIYRLIEDYEKWKIDQKKCIELKKLEKLVMPAKILFMPHHTFRQNNPAVIGVDVLSGVLKPGIELMKEDLTKIGTVKGIQSEKENVAQAEMGKQVAVSIDGPTVGRQIKEGEIFYSVIPEDDFRKLKEAKDCLPGPIKALLKEIADVMRRTNPVWGV